MKESLKFILFLTFTFNFYNYAISDTVEVVILQTTDIHAHVQYGDSSQNSGNWLRLATAIKRERRLAGGPNKCLIIDCGDTIQGTLVGALSKGRISVLLLDYLKYDSWILGNHELDFGIGRLKELITLCKTPIINGNLQLTEFPIISAYRVINKAGAKIVIIGMNAFLLDFWSWGKKMKGFTVNKAGNTMEKIFPEVMKHNPDMIIVALHQGVIEHDNRKANEVKTLAYRFPQIDLILGGHTHRKFAGKRMANSWYVQSGKHGEFLAKVIVKIDTQAHRVLDIQSKLLSSADYPIDQGSKKIIDPWLQKVRLFATKPICYVDKEVSSFGTPGYNCHMSEIICRAISSAAKVPVVFHGVLSQVGWPAKSYLTEDKLFETIPYENGIGKAELTLEELKEIIEEQLNYKGKRSFNGVYGMTVTIKKDNISVDQIAFPGRSPFLKDKRIPVAFNSYTIAGAGGRFPKLRNILRRPSSRLVDLEINSRDVLRKYLKNSERWNFPPTPWLRFQNSKK